MTFIAPSILVLHHFGGVVEPNLDALQRGGMNNNINSIKGTPQPSRSLTSPTKKSKPSVIEPLSHIRLRMLPATEWRPSFA
jgi:hypothetical protein